MEFSPTPPPSRSRWWRGVAAVLAAAALIAYARVLALHVDACAGGSDQSGYLNHARLLGSGHVHVPERVLPGLPAAAAPYYLYVPLGMKPSPHGIGTMVATYPTGLPLMILAVVPLVGWEHAGDVVLVLHALAGVLLTFALGRVLRLGLGWCALAAAILAASPLYLDFSLMTMSDVPALVWAAAAGIAAWRARASLAPVPRPGLPPAAWPLATGAALSMAVLVRPNNVLMLAPILVAWLPAARSEFRGARRAVAQLVLGGLPGAAFFCFHSFRAYGDLVTTGYGDPAVLFASAVVGATLRHYAHWLPVLFTPGVWLAGLLPLAAWRAARPAAFLGVWILAYLGFYVSYNHTHETWWYLRFLLPAIPALLIGAAWSASRVLGWLAGGRAWPRAIALPAFLIALGCALRGEMAWDRQFLVLDAGKGEGTYRLVARWLQAHVPANAAILTMQNSGSIFYYTDFPIVRWDELDAGSERQVLQALAAAHMPIYAPLHDFEIDDALKKRLPGRWQQVGQVRDVVIWQRTGEPAAP